MTQVQRGLLKLGHNANLVVETQVPQATHNRTFGRRPQPDWRPSQLRIRDIVNSSKPLHCLAKMPELSAGQAAGIPKYRRLFPLESCVFWLINTRNPPSIDGPIVTFLRFGITGVVLGL